MSAEIVSKSMQYRRRILGAFNLEQGLELSMPDIRDRIKKISGEDVSTLVIPILDLIKENLLKSRNGPPYPHRRGKESWGRIKLFSLKPLKPVV